MLRAIALSLSWTLAAELAAARLLGVSDRLDAVFIVLANVITNPLLVFIQIRVLLTAPQLVGYSLVLLELAAVTVEGAIYRRCLCYRKIRPYALSTLLNLISFGSGAMLTAIF